MPTPAREKSATDQGLQATGCPADTSRTGELSGYFVITLASILADANTADPCPATER